MSRVGIAHHLEPLSAPTYPPDAASLTPVAPPCGPQSRRPSRASPLQMVRVLRRATRRVVSDPGALAAASGDGTSQRAPGCGCAPQSVSHTSAEACCGLTRRTSSASAESETCSECSGVVQAETSEGGDARRTVYDDDSGVAGGNGGTACWGEIALSVVAADVDADASCVTGSCTPSASSRCSSASSVVADSEHRGSLEGPVVARAARANGEQGVAQVVHHRSNTPSSPDKSGGSLAGAASGTPPTLDLAVRLAITVRVSCFGRSHVYALLWLRLTRP